MKVHGPIEAVTIAISQPSKNNSPWMKVHGPIEAPHFGPYGKPFGDFSPWMKVHGPIEA